jgi:hypothetical protein
MRLAATAGWVLLALVFTGAGAAFFMAGLWYLGVPALLACLVFGIRAYGCASGRTAKLAATRGTA